MTIKDYVFGHRIELASPLDREAVALAVRKGIKSGFNPFYTGVVGYCRFGRVGLRWATAMWNNGFQPTFRGKLVSGLDGTRLEARFGAPPLLLIFLAAWYLLLARVLASVLEASINGTLTATNMLLNLGGIVLFLLIPVGFHLLTNRGADRHLESILAALKVHAGFEKTDGN